MPHLIVEYSDNLTSKEGWDKVPDLLRDAALETGIFPHGGIRVRLYGTAEYSIADGHLDNAFFSVVVRLGAGRTEDVKQKAGQHIFDALTAFFADEFKTGHFMLSLDMVENEPNLSFKKNSVHGRLKAESEGTL